MEGELRMGGEAVMSDCSTSAFATPEKDCRFVLEIDRDWYGKVQQQRVDAPEDMRLAWTCTHCGIQFSQSKPFPPSWMRHCPWCGWKVARA